MRILPERYNIKNLQHAIRNPSKFKREVVRVLELPYYTIPNYVRNRLFMMKYGPGSDFMKEDWDNMIILDACRYDIFAQVFRQEGDISGELQSRISKGSTSIEFMEENFVGKSLHDTVYVTGNPHTAKLDEDIFHAVITVNIEPLEPPEYEGFPDNSGAVRPKDVVEKALEANEQFPNKRLIIHFMTPHVPYLGETGAEIYRKIHNSSSDSDADGRWGNVTFTVAQIADQEGLQIDDETIRKAYIENLNHVLPYVDELLGELSGRSVVTADHGELLGENVPFANTPTVGKKVYGHYELMTTELRKVPWLIVDSGERRNITSEKPVSSDRLSATEIEQQLKALGYQ